MPVWTQPGRCSSCKYCSMDMGMEPFCGEPSVLDKHPYGLELNAAIRDYCGPDLSLRIPAGTET